ncbi:MAG TPA: acyl-CoA dehydrogenase family protein [Novosphingobium sp.]|nr:acyl-CoA dehydrogenase family protein [Novosphingobium sp.]
MNFEPGEQQELMRETFARFLDDHSSMARVRAATSGFDPALWRGLGEMGALALRVREEAGGLALGLFDAVLLMEEAGRTLVSGPLAETLVCARLLDRIGGEPCAGLVARAVLCRRGDDGLLVELPESARQPEDTLAATAMAEIDLAGLDGRVIGSGAEALALFRQGVEEWKLLIAAALSGLSREALRLASAYACERKQFGQLIGTFQGISHSLADLLCEVDGSRLLVWKAIRDICDAAPQAGAAISIAHAWAADTASRTVAQALHTFGGYGLSTEYDIHLYNLRAKAWPLVWGDPRQAAYEAGRRLHAGAEAVLPDAGDTPIEFDLGDEARQIASEIHAFFAQHVTDEMRRDFHYSWEGFNPELNRKLAAANLLHAALPRDVGGRGLSAYEMSAAMEAYEHQGYSNPAANVAAMVSLIIHRFGTDELKREVLPRIRQGDAICSLGFSEPGSGSDVFAAQCKATPEGNGWRIDGTKMFTSGANLADYVLMLCRTDPDAPKHKGLTMFIVPLKADGVTIQPVHTFQDERTNITFYDGVRIPDSWRLGEVNGGVRTMSASLELEHSASYNKSMRPMIRAAEALCREIRPGGRPLIEQPDAQLRLARATANLWVADLIVFRAMWAAVEKKPGHAFGPMSKLFSSEAFVRDSRDLMDLTAPHSLSKRTGPAEVLNRCYRHAQGTTIYGGTSEVQRSLIAERGLGLPRTRA